RHLQDHGALPATVGLSVWGTSTMRSGGEDLAQALALLGARPKWAAGSGRVLDRAVAAVPAEDESDDENPVRARVQREARAAEQAGLDAEAALRQASWRVFGPR
ncbi:cobaltochelatase subunit CobN, partial [Rubrivivax gelatinosus]|uniref:cobaltochelatase subunit CobN n=1 Tax=Rubrivivax gelatinosus TaxID=28068 RepID=UPI0005C1F19D